MKSKLYSLAVIFVLGSLALINAASSFPAVVFQDVTPTPTTKATIPVTGPAGDTSGIAFLGILIFVVIVAAIVMRMREFRAAGR
jgi:hypothetical protein